MSIEAFIREAKLATYAAQGDNASVSPAIAGSKQLEYTSGEWLYRDIYFGSLRFAGQEVVYRAQKPVWSMAYAGGLTASATANDAKAIYAFLRLALLQAPAAMPIRGPSVLVEGVQTYACTLKGKFEEFTGSESISLAGRVVYGLQFSGGLLA
jgi:hypothetical protein